MDDVLCEGNLDMFPTTIYIAEKMTPAIMDLKLTQNLESTFCDPVEPWSYFAWGDPETMDHTQGLMYQWLIRDIDLQLNPSLKDLVTPDFQQAINNNAVNFYYWVFDYKPEYANKFVAVSYNAGREAEILESIRKTANTIKHFNESGWTADPSWEQCKKCPVTDCPSRINIQQV